MLNQMASKAELTQAALLLRQGHLVAFPTETVYGLGADARNPEAVRRIFTAKGRPADHPLIVHLADAAWLADWAQEIPEAAWRLAAQFWPGPLALVLRKKPDVLRVVTGGQETVALRVPGHPVALGLLQAFGEGIAAPSANRFCRISPTQAAHVAEELGDAVAMILDGGPCQVGLESTIVDLSGDRPRLLRPGHIRPAEIAAILGEDLHFANSQTADIRAPGMMALHYAPMTRACRCASARLEAIAQIWLAQKQPVGVLTYSQTLPDHPLLVQLTMPQDSDAYAQRLYSALRELDNQRLALILIEQPPTTDHWRAINDRLAKAAAETC